MASLQPRNRMKGQKDRLPIVKSEDVEFSDALADEDDREAAARAAAADDRAQHGSDSDRLQ